MLQVNRFSSNFKKTAIISLSFALLIAQITLAVGKPPAPKRIVLKAYDSTPQSLIYVPLPVIPKGAKASGELSCNISQVLDSHTALSLVRSKSKENSLELISRYTGSHGQHTFQIKCSQAYYKEIVSELNLGIGLLKGTAESGVVVELDKKPWISIQEPM